MAFTEPHLLISVQGDAWAGTETWQFGVRARFTGLIDEPRLDALASALAAPTEAFFASAALGISNRARLLSLKVANVLTTGLYPDGQAPGIHTYAAPVPGTSGSTVIPQQTVAVTLLTARARGRASKGRFYLPPAFRTIGADGTFPATEADAIETAVVTWLNAINAAVVDGTQIGPVAVMSKLGTGTTNDVTAVGVGRVMDTMRSRRASLLEQRTPTTL